VQKSRKPATPPGTGKFVSNRRYPVPPPQPLNMDILAGMSDEELFNNLRSLGEALDKVYEHRLDPKPWEVEVAYIKRERDIRRDRREAHDKYLKLLERDFADSEAGLPVADLDNSAFLECYR